jgi:uncharacterized Zn-finger protein
MLFDYDFDKDQEICLEDPSKPNLIDCANCNKKFFTKENLELHQIFQHKIFFFKCPKLNCNKSFFREDYLNNHLNIVHSRSKISKPYKCQKIQKCINKGVAFKSQGELNYHLQRHGPKIHICNYCEKAFAMKSYLEAHIRTHTDEKKYSCKFENCNEQFITTSRKLWHEKHHH